MHPQEFLTLVIIFLILEFILGATDLRKVFTHTNITKAFRYIDSDNSEKLSMTELQAKLGDHIDEK